MSLLAALAAAPGSDNNNGDGQTAALQKLAATVSAAKQWAPQGALLPTQQPANIPADTLQPAAALPHTRRVANAALQSAAHALAAATGCGAAAPARALTRRPRGAEQPSDDADADGAAARAALVGQLLRLAACGPAGLHAATASARCAWSSDRACGAARAALACLSADDLGKLADAELAAAALLKPSLVGELTEAVAASACGGGGGGRGASAGTEPLDEVLKAHVAWGRLPRAVLASQPAAFRRTVATLLAWWKLTGHPRLWQLLGRTCRPVWLQLLQVQNGEPSSSPQQQQQQPLPDAAIEALYCDGAPLALARLLAQAPSRLAMRQLLAALPGCAAPITPAAAAGDEQSREHASPRAGGAATDNDSDGGDWLARGWPSNAELWGGWGGGSGGRSAAAAAAAITAAWRLAVQHPCWLEYAAWVLAHTSLQLRAMPPPATASSAAADVAGPTAEQQQAQQLQQQTRACPQGTQQPRPRSAPRPVSRAEAAQDAADAAALLAWLAAPEDAGRQRALRSALTACATETDTQQQQQQQPGSSQGGEQDAAAAATARAVGSLLAAWDAAATAAAAADGAGAWPWWLTSVTLPLALLQHPAVQLHGCGHRVLDACFGRLPCSSRANGGGDDSSSGGSEAGALMRALKAGQARDALRASSGAAAELLQSEADARPASQAAGGAGAGSQAPGAKRRQRTWLAACVRHALVSWPAPLPLAAGDGGGGGRQRPLVARLRLLCAGVERCEAAVFKRAGDGV